MRWDRHEKVRQREWNGNTANRILMHEILKRNKETQNSRIGRAHV